MSWYAAHGQDETVIKLLGGKINGYFVEFGATDGIHISNTYALEKSYGWSGIVAEAAKSWHKDLKNNRKCHVDLRCVWSKTGENVIFNETDNKDLSTIDNFSASDYWADARKLGKKYPVETVSLNDLLATYNAPEEIDFLSLDTEGTEFENLKSFDFQKYKINIILCVHNGSNLKEVIRGFLASKGYAIYPTHLTGEDFFILKGLQVVKSVSNNYVIALKRTPERIEKFLTNNKHLNFQIFDAVDGNDLTSTGNYSKYALANALSHIELWKRCAQGDQMFVICEDDAEIHQDFDAVISQIPKNFDFISFGWNFDADLWVSLYPNLSPVRMSFNQDAMRKNKSIYLNNPIDCSFFKLHLFNGTFCYAITPTGAAKFLEICYPLKNMISLAIPDAGDIQITPAALDSAMPEAYQITNSFVCFPPLALADNNHSESTVQNA